MLRHTRARARAKPESGSSNFYSPEEMLYATMKLVIQGSLTAVLSEILGGQGLGSLDGSVEGLPWYAGGDKTFGFGEDIVPEGAGAFDNPSVHFGFPLSGNSHTVTFRIITFAIKENKPLVLEILLNTNRFQVSPENLLQACHLYVSTKSIECLGVLLRCSDSDNVNSFQRVFKDPVRFYSFLCRYIHYPDLLALCYETGNADPYMEVTITTGTGVGVRDVEGDRMSMVSSDGTVLHVAAMRDAAHTISYLGGMYPGLLDTADSEGCLPIDVAERLGKKGAHEMLTRGML